MLISTNGAADAMVPLDSNAAIGIAFNPLKHPMLRSFFASVKSTEPPQRFERHERILASFTLQSNRTDTPQKLRGKMLLVRKIIPYIWSIAILAVVGAAAWGTYTLVRHDARPTDATIAPPPATVPATLLLGHDYYLWVRLIELNAKRLDGEPWDTGGSGPDIKFSISWKENTIYTSDKRADTLIAKWDLLSADVFELVKTRKIDLESAIRMPIVRVEAGTTVRLSIYDDDLTGDDLAGMIDVHLDTLAPGVNSLTQHAGTSIARLEIQAIDARITLPELIDLVSRR